MNLDFDRTFRCGHIMKMQRVGKLWNAFALFALALWLTPSLVWTCPQTGRIGSTPAEAMALSEVHCPAPQQASHSPEHCLACPHETVAPHAAAPHDGVSHYTLGNYESAGSCCVAAWLPDTQQLAPSAENHNAPAMVAHTFVLRQLQFAVLLRNSADDRAPHSAARGGPGSPRGPPAQI
jgi:hypothetical protein